MSRVLSGKPSQLARALVNDLCDKELEGCCCKKFINGLWKRSLPSGVCQSISSQPFTHDNFENIVQLADNAYQSGKPKQGVGTVAAMAAGPAQDGASDTAFHQYWPSQQEAEIAAFSRGRGRGRGQRGRGNQNRGGQGRGNRGSQNQSARGGQGNRGGAGHPRHKTTRHADLPPFEACFRHWTFGKSAHFCMEPASCPWKDHYVPKANN